MRDCDPQWLSDRQWEVRVTKKPMDEVDKQHVRDALIEQADAEVRALADQLGSERGAAELDPSDSHEVDDLSQSDEAGDLAGLSSDTIAARRRQRGTLEAMDFGPTDEVRPGAIIGLDGQHYVVGVVAAPFECGGVTYEGIAEDSPLYASIAGRRGGDSFTFRDVLRSLDFVM
jgi:hypothetical protein